jgi:hypothetical protein
MCAGWCQNEDYSGDVTKALSVPATPDAGGRPGLGSSTFVALGHWGSFAL